MARDRPPSAKPIGRESMEWARERKPKCRAENVSLMLLTSSRYFPVPPSRLSFSFPRAVSLPTAHTAPLPAAQDKYLSTFKLRPAPNLLAPYPSVVIRYPEKESKGSGRTGAPAGLSQFHVYFYVNSLTVVVVGRGSF